MPRAIRTWPSAKFPLYAVRDFEVTTGRAREWARVPGPGATRHTGVARDPDEVARDWAGKTSLGGVDVDLDETEQCLAVSGGEYDALATTLDATRKCGPGVVVGVPIGQSAGNDAIVVKPGVET